MNIVFVESLGMCECTINKSLATLKNQGHTVTFYHDRNENEEVLIERARNAEVVVVAIFRCGNISLKIVRSSGCSL